ncbi:uncharacterized protein LOC122512161 [Leptopilina heterotoma]|uniref:uncharacterized protein LOC122512161 n=1 Tax=Leptopilina heterotoma TaxID=63436 RepID=UPI001CA88F3D|nr:uncharacterized protein LOC122512161 [Leptopilina heterotoma]
MVRKATYMALHSKIERKITSYVVIRETEQKRIAKGERKRGVNVSRIQVKKMEAVSARVPPRSTQTLSNQANRDVSTTTLRIDISIELCIKFVSSELHFKRRLSKAAYMLERYIFLSNNVDVTKFLNAIKRNCGKPIIRIEFNEMQGSKVSCAQSSEV